MRGTLFVSTEMSAYENAAGSVVATIARSSAVSSPSKKSGIGHRRTGPRVPPRRNTSRSNTGRNACNICAAPGGGFFSISGVTPKSERWAASAEEIENGGLTP